LSAEAATTATTAAKAGGGCHLFSGCGFPAPGLNDFEFKPLFSIGSFHFTKPMLLAVLCALTVIVFFWAAFAKPKLVPRGMQNVGELAVLTVRDQILRPAIGRRGDGYLPFLCSMFFFIFLMNLMELIPVFQFPVTSRIGFVWPIVFSVYGTYIFLAFKHKGLKVFKQLVPSGVPLFVLPLLFPVELLRIFIIQPFTLGVRLFGNMFAGHLLLSIFMIATWYLMSFSIGLVWAAGSLAMVVFVFLLEMLVDLLQAFIFTTLTATYIAESLDTAGH
jgi:F-type H+-transporting ATPase subunit a